MFYGELSLLAMLCFAQTVSAVILNVRINCFVLCLLFNAPNEPSDIAIVQRKIQITSRKVTLFILDIFFKL